MKNLFTYLKALWSRVADSQSTDVRHDCRLTVGSPSGLDAKWKQNPFMRFAVVLTLIFTIGSGNVWGASETYTFNSKSWGATNSSSTTANWSGTKDGNQFNSSATPLGVQVCTAQSGVVVTCPDSYDKITKVEVVYSSSSKGVGSINVQVGANTALGVKKISKSQTRTTLTWTPSNQTGQVKITCNCTTNSYGINSVTITYRDIAVSKTSITGLDYVAGSGPSTAQSFTASGTNLSGNLTVTAPTNFEVSKTSSTSGFAGSVSLTASSGTVSSTTIYVRLKSGLSAGTYGGASTYVTVSGGSATTKNVSVSGTVSSSATIDVTGVSVSPTSKSIIPGETFTITPTIAPANATDKVVSWTSNETSKATVSNGTVTGVAAGTSTITCTTHDGGFTATCVVTVRGVTLQARDEDGNAIGVGGPGAPTRSGTTITAAANAGNYVFKQWQVTNASVASTTTTPTTISDPTGAVTVTAVYYKPVTITYKANGATFTTQTYARGGTLAFPVSEPDGATYSCTGKTFVGWVGEANKDYSHASIAPTYVTAGSSVTEAATYYAVFATQGGSGSVTKSDELVYTSFFSACSSSGSNISGSYTDFSNKSGSESDAVYAGNLFKHGNGPSNCKDYIQMRTSSNCGFYTTTSGGKAKKVTLEWDDATTSARTVDIYGKNTAYSAIGDLFDNAKQGTLLGSITWASPTPGTELTITGDYEYIGLRSNSSALYLSSITIDWQASGGYTYSDYATNCCTPLGTINGSFTLSSTGTSVTATVTTAGGSAYEDAANVSGYEFKLYTAASGGSASASYSTNSSAGTSHEFTGLDPLTDYWVTVRPIGDGSTYCNTTAESSRVQIATTCVAPNHVDISGRWDRFGGETISLTAAAYSSAGTSSPIDAENITGYQWQKLISSTWTDVSDGTTDGVTTSGATTKNLQISNCKLNNSGKYRCVISTGATCSTASATATDGTEGFDVKVYVLECYTGGTTVYNFTRVGDTQAGTAQITLAAGSHTFKFHADNIYYGNDGTINEDVTNWVCSTSQGNLTIAAGLGGTFTISMEYSTSGSSSVEGEPEISVTYPRKTIYLTPGVWNTGGAKFAFYYFRDGGSSGWTDFITANDCGSSADIPQWNGVKINAVRLSNECSSPDWSDKWNQTSNITITSNNSVSITGWGPDKGDSPYDYGTYAVPTYTISYAKGSTTYTGGNAISGSKDSETKTCGVNFTLPSSAVFTTTGYTQTGWATEDGGSKAYNLGGSYTTNAAQAFYPAWTANNHTLTWDANGGDALTGDYTTGTVAYGTAITAPNTPTWTGHTFGGWHNGSSVVTPATSMPDNDLTYTAQWSLATYTVTLNTNGGTINVGNVTSYTYSIGATLPTNVTKDGNRFDGWFDNKELDGDAVTSISSSATGNKEYWAKWTPVRTVTWSVNGSTWSSGVVEGNTHVISGEKVSALPTAPTKSDCDDAKVFVGWRATAIDGTSTSDPGGIFTTQAGSPAIDVDKTFYAVFADASPRQVISLTFPDDNSDNNGLTSNQYTSEWTAKAGTFSFTVNNFNNNNWGGSWEWIKCGRKSNTSVAKITTDTDVDFRVDSVYITIGSIADSYVNSAKLQISSSSDFGTKTEMDIPQSTGTQKLKIASPATDKYYRIVYDCASHPSSNGFVQINSLEFIQKSETSNYVTTCASCDENATYTNTTPTVSDIDCTGATLTMEDGLATVGADGCHVSDYGFVIGTSDNPAVGGDGVTKLQVGTSDPTIGADFSYDATGLTKGTRYYIRAYATNLHGTAYSTSTNFWTKDVSSIAITTAPTKTNYIVGETFDATGMVVTATMASGATEDVTSDVTYSSSALTAGTSQNFAINYTLCETAKSVNQVINVYTLTVTEGTNPSYGTASGSVNIVSITGLGEHKTYTVTVTSSNATAVDNGDNTWTITNPTGNVAVRVDYAEAAQVKVYYKVDGVTVTGLTQDVYQSETTTLPTASELATAMTAQSMDIPDDDYPNFIGWSETEFPAQTAEPTIVTGTPTINAEKTYYAVYSNINKKSIKPSDFAGSYATNEGEKTIDDEKYQIHDICLQSSQIQFKSTPGYLYTKEALAYIKKIEITGLDLVVNACSDNAGTLDGDAITPTGSDTYVYTFPASKQYFKIKGKGGTDKVSLIEIFYANSTVYYMTQFCATKVVLTHNSPEHGSVEFSRSSLATCGSDKNVSLTIIPDVGYQLTGWTVNTSSGYADAKTTSPAVVTNSNNSAAQNITLTFAQDANKDYDVTATFGLMTVTSWAWTMNSAAIPDPLNLYVGQSARLDVAYTPAGVDASKKTYERTKVDAYINWSGAPQATYSTISGRASTGENTTPVTFTHADGPSTTVNVKVLPLPAVHFGDIVHNVAFDDVVATLSDNTLSPTKTTPTHADFTGSTANTCEEEHLHLVGWIREDWPALVTYLNGGAQPSTSDITTAGDDASGNAYFFAPGASINTQTFNGVTFYAVWAKVE